MTHRIYFAQHGLAVDKADNPERPLSTSGINQTTAIAQSLLNSKIPITRVFHSGKLRASQTADIFAKTMNIATSSVIDGLSPNDDVTQLAQNLNINHALYIGHLPHLEKLLAYLLSNDKNNNIIKFQNSGIICLSRENGAYHINWLLTPELTGLI